MRGQRLHGHQGAQGPQKDAGQVLASHVTPQMLQQKVLEAEAVRRDAEAAHAREKAARADDPLERAHLDLDRYYEWDAEVRGYRRVR